MNWKQIKEAIEKQGVTDETEIMYIDIDGVGEPEVRFDDKATVHIVN